jgi:poly(hydroxyalkanoate) depolymerase family esterase
VPAGLDPRTAAPLVCMLHGCTQDAASFAGATRMNAEADRHGFVVVYPQQGRADNPQGCWNWFVPEHQGREAGEPAWIAGAVREAAAAAPATIDARRVFVAGLSAGGAMAAVLARAYPDVFAAAAVHSGLAPGSAANLGAALNAMARGAAGDAADAPGPRPEGRVTPTMVVHGTADRTVAPANAEHVLRAAMRANELAAPGTGRLDPSRPSSTVRGQVDGGHAYLRSRWTDRHGALRHELLLVEGLGHAWSGGAAGGSFTDPQGPDATAAIWRFFAEASARPARALH